MPKDDRETQGERRNAASQRRERVDRREAVFQAAWRRFAERPYDDVTLQQIAEDVGITRSTLIGLVGHKEPLYRRCFDRAVDALAQDLEAAVRGGDAETRLRSALEAFVTFAEERSDAWSFVERHVLASGRFADDAARMRKRLGEAVVLAVADRPANPSAEAAAGAMLGAVRATANWQRGKSERMERDELIDQLVSITWHGLGDVFRPGPRS